MIGCYGTYEALVESYAADLARYGTFILSYLLAERVGEYRGVFYAGDLLDQAVVIRDALTYG